MNGEFDIDLGIYFNWDSVMEGTKRLSPLELKTMIQNVLLEYKNIVIDEVKQITEPPKERCSRISFEGNFHIDIPVYHQDERINIRLLATEKNIWEISDPKLFYDWFINLFPAEDASQVRRIIRYFKIWSSLHLDKPAKSIMLTVLVADAYTKLNDGEIDGDDLALRNVADHIADRLTLNSYVTNPVNEDENLNRLSEMETAELVSQLRILVNKSDVALQSDIEIDAYAVWSEIFQHFFPPINEISNNSSFGRAIVPVSFIPRVSIVAIAKNNKDRPFTGIDKIGPIPKNCTINFNLTNANKLPPGSTVQWMVRNDGDEAGYVNDLGHFAGNSILTATENSAYNGKHYMDLIIKSSYGSVLGYGHIPVIVSDLKMPARNSKKPSYVKIKK
jgi:hypothetical protein